MWNVIYLYYIHIWFISDLVFGLVQYKALPELGIDSLIWDVCQDIIPIFGHTTSLTYSACNKKGQYY